MENNITWLRERLESYRQGNDDDGYILIPINKLEILLTQMQEKHKQEHRQTYEKGGIYKVNYSQYRDEDDSISFEQYYTETYENK
jgi:hypothetical protein